MVEETPLNSKYSVKDYVKMLNETEPKVRQNIAFSKDNGNILIKLSVFWVIIAKLTNLLKFDLFISLQEVESLKPFTRSVVEFVHLVKMPVRVHLTSR